jgi:hypothetical protein
VAIYDLWQRITLCGKWYYCHTMTVVATTLLATKSWHGNTDYCNDAIRGKCLFLHYQPLHVPPLATKTGMASAYIATIVNVEITSYCHARQRTAMVERNPNSCNDKLATIAIPYCNVTFCNHWQRTRFGCNFYFATKLGLLQRFFIVAQGLEVSSLHSIHTYEDGTSCSDMLAPCMWLGFYGRARRGGG